MKVIRGLSTNRNQPLTSPFPVENWMFIELRGGDFLHPRGDGDWFKPPYFDKVIHKFIKYPIIPFISWKFGKHGGYIGAKAYGVDSPEYKKWPAMKDLQHEIYDGSHAIMFSIRPHANLE